MNETPRPRYFYLHAALAVVAAVVVAVYLGWPALIQADRFHENWRQSPQWISPEKQHFQDDDLLVRYSEFNTTPFGNALYKTLALTGHDIVWGKVMTVVVFALAALSCFLTASAMSGLPAGWVAVVLFLFFPSAYEYFVGGFMACFSWPLLGFAVLLIYRRLWWWSIPLVALSALVYPMVGIHIGMMLFVDTVFHDLWPTRRGDKPFWFWLDKELWRTKLLPLALAALALVMILGGKYFEDHGFGELVTRADMQDRVEFTKKGRYTILPTTPLWTRFDRQWENFFHIPLLAVAVFFLGRSAFRLPRGIYTLLIASIIMYYIADYLVMQLYLPSRYVRRSLPLFSCLVGGIWWARIYYGSLFPGGLSPGSPGAKLGVMRRLAPLIVVTALFVGIGVHEFADDFEPGDHTHVYNRHGLYEAIRQLPGRPMIAAWPMRASDIPLMTGRTVLVNREQAHPWWSGWWDEVTERTQEFWRAYFTGDPAELKRVVDKYGIDYWVVEPRYYRRGSLNRGRVHDEPLNSWLRNMPRLHQPLLAQVPPEYRLYQDRRHYIVSSADLFRWLEQP